MIMEEALIIDNDASKKYLDYLYRYVRDTDKTPWQAHQEAISREVAREYGVGEDGLKWLDENL